MCENGEYQEERNQKVIPIETAKGVYIDTYGSEIMKKGSFEEITALYKQEEPVEEYFRPLQPSDLQFTDTPISTEDVADFKFLQQKGFRGMIEQSLGISLKELTLSEQFYFLNYCKTIKNKESEELISFCQKYDTRGLRTFLSMEQEDEEDKVMGDKILELGKVLPKEVAENLFLKYSEIIDGVDKITEFIEKKFTREIKTNTEFIRKIESTLLARAKQLLEKIYQDLYSRKDVEMLSLMQELDRINADTITTFAIFKQAIRSGEKLPIESIEGSIFSKKEATLISKAQQEEMLDLYKKNYSYHPDREFISKVTDYFKTAFVPKDNQSRNNFYTFEKDAHIRAFVRFEKQKNGSLYASALNVDEASKNFGLGEAMMDEALAREAQENILHAKCLKENPSNMRYFEKGFISKESVQIHNTQEFDLVWDELKNKNIISKQKTPEELISMYLKNTYEGSIEIKKSTTLQTLHDGTLPAGKALVRCFPDPLKTGEWYAVYESIIENYGVNNGETK